MNVLKSTIALNKTYTDTPANARRLAHRVADDIIMATKGFRGICSGRIVMVGNGTGNKELYLCDADGGNLHQLTRDRSISLAPHWSPDGSRIVYTSFLKGGYADIYMINTQTGGRSVVARYPGINMAGGISPSGGEMLMVLSRDGNPEVYSKTFTSGQLTRLTRTQRAGEASPTWSPDGAQIAYVSDLAGAGSPQIYVMDRSGSSRRLTSRGKENVDPDWGANNLIAFSSRRGGLYGIYIINPASMDERLVSPPDSNYKDPAWASDGRHLVCCRQEGGSFRIYLLDTMGDPPVCLTPNGGSWFSPAWCSK
jgi:TolB protein